MKNRIRKYQSSVALVFAITTLSGCGGGGTAASAADTTAPTTTATLSVSGTTDSTTTLSVTVNENGTGYYLARAAAASAPTVADVQAGTSFPLTANVPATRTIGGLTFYTPYAIYFVAKDAANNVQAVQNVLVTTAPTTAAGYVTQGGLTWSPNTLGSTTFGGDYMGLGIPGGYAIWSVASTYCTTATINGVAGWRLPTLPELNALYAAYPNNSSALIGQGWATDKTWSSTQYVVGTHSVVDLYFGYPGSNSDTNNNYVSCVR